MSYSIFSAPCAAVDLARLWSLEKVIASGRKHGATPEDIHGCLYFHLSDELRKLQRRLRLLKISINLFNMDAIDLGRAIETGDGIGQTITKGTKFDRVEVSNIVDSNYVGFKRVLQTWGSRLNKKNIFSTLMAYSMNWVMEKPGGQPHEYSQIAVDIQRLLADERVSWSCPGLGSMSVCSPSNQSVGSTQRSLKSQLCSVLFFDGVFNRSAGQLSGVRKVPQRKRSSKVGSRRRSQNQNQAYHLTPVSFPLCCLSFQFADALLLSATFGTA